jgi:predicted alpha/beta hydrolase family esterase
MKKQVFVIHGGDAFPTYEEYISYLQNETIDIERFKIRGWKSSLGENLGNEYEVIQPRMPNPENAKYLEWKIWFEKFVPFLTDGVILLGHSLGGIFLAKYLAEENFPKKIRATFLAAAPFNKDGDRAIVEFDLPASLEKLKEQGGEIFLYHSKDDPVVQFSELAKYQQALPEAHVTVFEEKQHLNQEQFPEIVEAIKSL